MQEKVPTRNMELFPNGISPNRNNYQILIPKLSNAINANRIYSHMDYYLITGIVANGNYDKRE